MNKLWLNYAVTVEGCRFDVVLVHLLETLAGYSVLDRIFGTFRDPVFVAAQFFFCRSAPLLRGQILTSFHQTQLVRLFVRVTARRSTYVTEFQSKSRHVTRSTIDDRSFVLFSLDWKSRDHTRTHTHTHYYTVTYDYERICRRAVASSYNRSRKKTVQRGFAVCCSVAFRVCHLN